jgi:hypothetical protein
VDKQIIKRVVGALSREDVVRVDTGLRVALGLP